jgi:hypothetical protein
MRSDQPPAVQHGLFETPSASMYDSELAKRITESSREILQQTIEVINNTPGMTAMIDPTDPTDSGKILVDIETVSSPFEIARIEKDSERVEKEIERNYVKNFLTEWAKLVEKTKTDPTSEENLKKRAEDFDRKFEAHNEALKERKIERTIKVSSVRRILGMFGLAEHYVERIMKDINEQANKERDRND